MVPLPATRESPWLGFALGNNLLGFLSPLHVFSNCFFILSPLFSRGLIFRLTILSRYRLSSPFFRNDLPSSTTLCLRRAQNFSAAPPIRCPVFFILVTRDFYNSRARAAFSMAVVDYVDVPPPRRFLFASSHRTFAGLVDCG